VLKQKRQVKYIITLKSVRTLKKLCDPGWETLL